MDTNEAEELVRRFLRLMEDRDLETAETYMATKARITFPGGRTFASQREMVAAAGGRYKWIKKQFDRVESFRQEHTTVVYVQGTLYGVNLHHVPFANVRFIDRFVIENDHIVQQDVWNDLAESGVLARTT